MFPENAIKRPYDIYPLIPYLLCGLVVFPFYYKRHRTLFALSLILSIMPQVATQLYKAFGSFKLHDSFFNIAHALKAVAYMVPILGLMLEYIRTYRRQKRMAFALAAQTEQLNERTVAMQIAQVRMSASTNFAAALNQTDAAKTYESAVSAVASELEAPLIAVYATGPDNTLAFKHATYADSQLPAAAQLSAEGLPTAVMASKCKTTLVGPFDSSELRLWVGFGEVELHSIVGWPVRCRVWPARVERRGRCARACHRGITANRGRSNLAVEAMLG